MCPKKKVVKKAVRNPKTIAPGVVDVVDVDGLQKAFASAGILAKGEVPDFQKLKGKVAIIRCGKAIDEPTTLAEKDSDVVFINIDSDTELRQRGLVHDGWRNFAIEYYFSRTGAAVYADLETTLLSDPRFRELFAEIKAGVFKYVKTEEAAWANPANPADSLQAQPLENLGGGGAIYLGALRIGAAVRGREYQPNTMLSVEGVPNPNYDIRDDMVENPHLPKRDDTVRSVSLLSDLLAALKRERVKIAVIAGGFDGATGSSCLLVLGKMLLPVKSFSTVPLCMCTLPEYVLVKTRVPSMHADRLNAMVSLLGRCGVLGGMGQGGIVWKVIADYAGEWGGLYVNVYNLSKSFSSEGPAPVLTIAAMPFREDLETRFLLGLMTLSDMPLDKAREIILRYASDAEKNRVRLKAKPFRRDLGVEITVHNASKLLIHQWQELMPALTAFHRHVGEDAVTLPVKFKKVVGHGFFGPTEREVTEEKPIQSVVMINVMLDGIGAKQVADLQRRPETWILMQPEAALIKSHQMKTFDECFTAIFRDFSAFMTEILLKGLFGQYVYNPTVKVYDSEDLPKTVVVWGMINVGTAAYADKLIGDLFAPVDRSEQEAAALAILEREREKKVQQQTSQALTEIFAQLAKGDKHVTS